MAAIAISPAIQLSNSPEARKALSIPVTGAVVIAPFKASVVNYGSLGGEFTAVGGSPSFSDGCVLTAGKTLYKVVGAPTGDFTLVSRIKASTSILCSLVSVGVGSPSAESSTGVGVAVNLGYFILDRAFIGSVSSGISSDTNWHTFTLKRSGSNTLLYIDGSLVVNTTGAINVTGTAIAINGVYDASSHMYSNYLGVTVRNLAYYTSELSPVDLALVEAWAAS